MSTLIITEGQNVGKQTTGSLQAMTLPALETQYVTFTGTPGYSAATDSNANVVRLYADANCAVLASLVSSASVGSVTAEAIWLAADTPEYFSTMGLAIYFSVVSRG